MQTSYHLNYKVRMEGGVVWEKNRTEYDAFRNPSIVEEQPFYYKGMSRSEYEKELAYLNQNLSSFYEGSYVPLWKQSWYQ